MHEVRRYGNNRAPLGEEVQQAFPLKGSCVDCSKGRLLFASPFNRYISVLRGVG